MSTGSTNNEDALFRFGRSAIAEVYPDGFHVPTMTWPTGGVP